MHTWKKRNRLFRLASDGCPSHHCIHTLSFYSPEVVILITLRPSSHRSTYVVVLTEMSVCLQRKCTTLRVISGQS